MHTNGCRTNERWRGVIPPQGGSGGTFPRGRQPRSQSRIPAADIKIGSGSDCERMIEPEASHAGKRANHPNKSRLGLHAPLQRSASARIKRLQTAVPASNGLHHTVCKQTVAGQMRGGEDLSRHKGARGNFPPGGIQRRGCGVIANGRFVRMGTDRYGDGLFKIKPMFEFF